MINREKLLLNIWGNFKETDKPSLWLVIRSQHIVWRLMAILLFGYTIFHILNYGLYNLISGILLGGLATNMGNILRIKISWKHHRKYLNWEKIESEKNT